MKTPLKTTPYRNALPARQRNGGFSIVELLVSVAVGLLALSFATRLVGQSEQNKQNTLGGSDSMQNGVLAMFQISSDASQAGWGINDPIVTGCDTLLPTTAGFQLAPAKRDGATVRPLAAVVIEPDNEGSDRVSFYSGGAMGGTGSITVAGDIDVGATRVPLASLPYGMKQDDVIVVASDDISTAPQCQVAQISNDPTVPPAAATDLPFLEIAAGGDRDYTPGAFGTAFRASQARVFNLGAPTRLSFHTWSVSNGFLRLQSTDLQGSAATPATVVDNIVAIKAQYGFDTRVGTDFTPEKGIQIGRWSSTMIDADGDTKVGAAADYQRVAAVRIAVVARGRAPERPAPGEECSTTTAEPKVFASSSVEDVDAVPVTVKLAVAGDTVPWQCYRYRVFETIVPLRNHAWRPTAL